MLVALAGIAGMAGAQSLPDSQSENTQSAWIVYKPITRVANKQLFESHLLHASHRTSVSSLYPNTAMTKAVHRAEKQIESGNILSSGYPAWTISKPIHRK